MIIFFVHLFISIILFILINWIGKHSYSIGYISLSMFARTDEAPALNFLLRVFTPVVYLIIISAILYKLDLDKYVINIYLVSLYYILIRLAFNLITNRSRLLNWNMQITYWVSISILSYLAYKYIIQTKINLIPDLNTIANELWIIILIFLYHLFNKLQLNNEQTQIRKDKYLHYRYSNFNKKYESIIARVLANEKLQALSYSILIYEDFNRPKIIRFVEYLSFFILRKPHTLGIMQIRTDKYINDIESVNLGLEKLLRDYIQTYKEHKNMANSSYYERYHFLPDLIAKYNGGKSYQDSILELYDIILDKYYNSTTSVLIEYNEEKITNYE